MFRRVVEALRVWRREGENFKGREKARKNDCDVNEAGLWRELRYCRMISYQPCGSEEKGSVLG